MTPAEAAVLAAARAYRDAHEAWVKSYTENREDPDRNGLRRPTAVANAAMQQAALDLVDAPTVEAPTVATARPWPDPEAYKALAEQVFGQRDPAAGGQPEVAPAVAAWKALRDGQQVLCARGYVWTAKRNGEHLRFAMARPDGKPGKVIEQPWYPLIMARLPVWPIVVETAG